MYRHGLRWLVPCIFLLSACRDSSPSSPSAKPAITGLEIEIQGELIEAGDTVQLRLIGIYAGGRRSPVVHDQAHWTVSDPILANVEGGQNLVTKAPGSLRVSAEFSGLVARSEILIPPVQLDRVILMNREIAGMLSGGSWDLQWQALSKRGRVVPGGIRPTFVPRNSQIVQVDSSGEIRALSAGHTFVLAIAASRADSVAVTVLPAIGDLGLVSIEPLAVEPGNSLSFHGRDLGDASVMVSGQTVPVSIHGDTVLRFDIPPLRLFEPCLPPTSVALTVRAGSKEVSFSLPGEAPLRVRIQPGRREPLDGLVASGCRLEVESGKYVIVAGVVDREELAIAGRLSADSVIVRIEATHETHSGQVPTARIAIPGMIAPAAPEHHLLNYPASLPRSREKLSYTRDATSLVTCTNLQQVGDSILIPTSRNPDGKFTWWNGAGRDEWWHVVAETPHVLFVVDSSGRRVWQADEYTRRTAKAVMALYDTAWVPIFRELYDDDLPDSDGNGRMIWSNAWNSAVGGGGGTGFYQQSGCPNDLRAGEAFYTPLEWWSSNSTPPYLIAYYRASALHEAIHTHDLARRAARYGWWWNWPAGHHVASEGIASFVPEYWVLRHLGEPLTGNHVRVDVGNDGVQYGGALWEVFPQLAGNYSWNQWAANGGYPQSAQFIAWVTAQAVHQGRRVSSVLTDLAYGARATYGSIYRLATGTNMSDRDVLAAWALSWYVDDRVIGADHLLTYPVWNIPRAHAAHNRQLVVPMARIAETGALEFGMNEPDVKLIELEFALPARISLQAVRGRLINQVFAELLRVE
jgi:hypothetical protein